MDKEEFKRNLNLLQSRIEEILEFYHSHSCQCAFPRFRQYVSIDCADTGNSFYVNETETFISNSSKYFDIQPLTPERGGECYLSIYTCKKCGSTYEYGWSDFSIYINRSYLKLKEQKTNDIGKEPINPIPIFLGPIGHSYLENTFVQKDLESLTLYLKEIKGN
ncbi:MAG TPA: hypothetical protein PKZ75_08755 [Bacteroidia bacterium]|nr:hypothetical protein [Bacteroidia bacterium]